MHWSTHLILLFAPVITVGVFLLVLNLIIRRTIGYAPDWQIRCTTCHKARDAAEAGLVRVGAFSIGHYTLGRCSNCGRFRIIAIERKQRPIE